MRRSLCVLALLLSGLLASQVSAQQVVTTFSAGAPGDPFSGPTRLVLDKLGNLFVSDTGNHRVQRIDVRTGAVTTVAGTGSAGYSGDGGPATLAQLDCPRGLAFDAAGSLYIADFCRNVIRKVTNGIITTFAGNGSTDACAWTDDVAAAQTPLDSPDDVAVDRNGNVFILSHDCYDLIRRVDAASGLISTPNYMLGSRGSISLVFDNVGDLLIMRFYQIALCPASGGLLTGNEICDTVVSGETNPYPMAVDASGSLYFLDDPCDSGCLTPFKATPGPDGTLRSGSSAQYAGNGFSGYSGDGGPPLDASFRNPHGLAVDANGNLFIADTGNNVIRMVSSGPSAPTLTSTPTNPSNQPTATFEFTDGDPTIASFACTLDQATSPCTSGVTYSNLNDGAHTFSVVPKASDGTPGGAASFSWIVDTVPPPTPSLDAHPSDPSATANASFAFSDTEIGVSFICSLDASENFCSSPLVLTGLSDGRHVFSVQARDAAGNRSTANTFAWTIHTVVPPAPHIDSAPAVLSNKSVSTFTFSDTQGGLSFLCKLDAGGFSPCLSPINYLGLPDGPHTFTVVASDPVVGRSSTPAAYAWTLDTTPPKVGIRGAAGVVTIPAPSQFSFTGGSDDVVGYLCSVDGGAFAPCTSPFTQSVTSPGTHTFAVEAVDAAGNVGAADSTNWSVTYCHCTLFGNYTNPAFNDQEFVQSSPDGQFKVSAAAGASQQTNVSLIRTSDGAVVYSFVVPALYTAGWQFSPDSTHFWYLTGPAYTTFGSFPVTVLDLTASTPKPILTFSLASAGSSILEYSPSGAYLMTAEITSTGHTAVSIYRIGGVSNGVRVHSTELSVALFGPEGGGVASWGFNQNPYGEPETAFMYAWSTGPNLFAWNVVNLAKGQQVISQTSTAISAYWQFNPCGNIIAFVNQSSLNEEQVDLFSVDDGKHIGETSFPLQAVTLTSQPNKDSTLFQEVATISNPQQTIVITNDPTCDPNTQPGSGAAVAPMAPHSNTSPATVTFSMVTQAGGTGVSTSSTGNAPPAGFELGDPPVYYDVATSASYTGTIVLCFNYAGITFNGQPRLFHFQNSTWVDVTISVDTTNQVVCGSVTSLSPFAIFSSGVQNHPPTVQAGLPEIVEAASPAGAIVALTGSASDPDNDPLTLTWRDGVTVLGSGAQISATLSLGVHTITITADDGRGGVTTAAVIVTVRDTTPPVVTAPLAITVPATDAAGARGSAWPALATFLAGGTAKDLVDVSPVRLAPQAGSVVVDNSTLFPCGTTQVTFSFKDASGNVGRATASVTVVVGSPKVSGAIVGRGTLSGGSMFLDLKLTNTGTGNGRNLAVDLVLAVPLKGQGLIKTVSPTKPVVIGNFDVGSTQTIRVVLAVPAGVKQFLLTAGGTLFNVQGTFDLFAVTQVVNP